MTRKLFKNTTLKQKLILWFKEHNYQEVECRSGKYRCFEGSTGTFYFIGRSGGVRINHKNSVSGSHSYTSKFKKIIKEWAKEQKPEDWVEV